MKALAAGVPLLLLPHGRDQADTAVRVSMHGAGVTLKRSTRPERIATAVRLLLEDAAYRAAAQRLGEEVRRDAAGDVLVSELEDAAADRDRAKPASRRRIS